VPGLFVDKSNTTFNADAPLFIERSEPNLFVDVYLEKNINKKH
jgi:hypothetical protein